MQIETEYMPRKSTSIRIPEKLYMGAKQRAEQEGYESLSEYVVGLIRFDLMTGKPHVVTGPLSHEGAKVQAAIDKGILSGAASRKEKLSYLEHLIGDTASVISSRIADALPEIIQESLASGEAITRDSIQKRVQYAMSKPKKPKPKKK